MRVVETFKDLVPPTGTIAIMSSGQGSVSNNETGGYEVYRASKAALNTLMRSFAARHRDDPRTLLLLAPGWVRTDMGGPMARLSIQDSIPNLVKVIGADLFAFLTTGPNAIVKPIHAKAMPSPSAGTAPATVCGVEPVEHFHQRRDRPDVALGDELASFALNLAKANPRLRPLHLVVRETEFCGLRLAGYFRRRMRENSRNSVRRPRCASLTRRNYGGFCLPGNRPGLSGLHGGGRSPREPVCGGRIFLIMRPVWLLMIFSGRACACSPASWGS